MRTRGKKAVEGDDDDDEQEWNSRRMDVRYVQCLDVIVGGNIQTTYVLIKSTLRGTMGIRGGEEPDDFPSLDELVKWCALLEKKLREKGGCWVDM